MKQFLHWTLVLLLGFASVAVAQNSRIVLHIEPSASSRNPLPVEPGEVIQFSATAYEFTSSGTRVEVPITALTWAVDPAAFGSITQQGEFTATTQPANMLHGKITATASVGTVTVSGSVVAELQVNTKYTFAGTVRHGNTAIEGAKVSVMNVGMLPFMVDGHTDAHGAFSIDVPPGSYIVRAHAAGYLPQYFDGAQDAQDAEVFDTDPAQLVIANIDFNLGKGGSIRGLVTDAATGDPLENAVVAAFEGNNTRPPGNAGQFAARTDAHGAYVIEGLPDGDYLVTANLKGYITQFYDGQDNPSTATPVTVSGAATIDDIDFALDERQPDPVFTFSGSVHAGTAPVAGATVSVISKGMPPFTIDGQTDAHGNFNIEVLRSGSYIVRAEAGGYVTQFFDNSTTATGAHVFVTDPTQLLIGNVNFNLTKGGSIRGLVTDVATGAPMENVLVAAIPDGGSVRPPSYTSKFHARTDAYGTYVIDGLPDGEYRVVASIDGYRPQFYDGQDDLANATKVAVTAAATVDDIDFSLHEIQPDPVFTISGTVRGDNGHAIADATVFAEMPGGPVKHWWRAKTAHDGSYTLEVSAGTFVVWAVAQGYGTKYHDDVTEANLATTLTLGGSVTAVTDIDFVLQGHNGSIAGIVTDAAGNPLADVAVAAWVNGRPASNTGHHMHGNTRTANDGSYLIERLAPGDYLVRAHGKNVLPQYYDGETDIRNASVVSVASVPVTGIDFTLERGGSIAGTVFDADNNAAIPHAVVIVRSTTHRFERGARTDAHGNYLIEGLPADDYIVLASAHRYLGMYYDEASTLTGATPVTVTTSAAVAGIDFPLRTIPANSRNASGIVNARGSDAAELLTIIEAIHPENGTVIFTSTDALGQFEFPAWEHAIIRARAIGYVGLYAGNTRNWSEGGRNGVSGIISFMLEPAVEAGLATCSGILRDAESGDALVNAWVYGSDAMGNSSFAVTGPNGEFTINNTTNGTLNLTIAAVGYEQSESSTEISDATGNAILSARRTSVLSARDVSALPSQPILYQNYPNPFNPATTIRFLLPQRSDVTIRVFDLLGREMAVLADGMVEAGLHETSWNASTAPSGIYLYRLDSQGMTQTRRMLLTK